MRARAVAAKIAFDLLEAAKRQAHLAAPAPRRVEPMQRTQNRRGYGTNERSTIAADESHLRIHEQTSKPNGSNDRPALQTITNGSATTTRQ
jgi:hypothetical protein